MRRRSPCRWRLLILIAVFSSLVAAGMPLLVAALAIPTTLGIVDLLAERTEMSIYVLNTSTMLGLALAIDYSLFLVSRFREELARGRSSEDAVVRAVATAGKAVVFSAVAVAIGLSGLTFFKASALTSIGVTGVLVVAASAIFAVTFLPAVLGMLGPRVNALSVATLLRRAGLRRRPATAGLDPSPSSRWERIARWVMRHPVAVIAPVLAFLLALGIPFADIRQAVPDAAVFPPGVESRDAAVALQARFPPGETTPVVVLAQVQGDPDQPGQRPGPGSLRGEPGGHPGNHPRGQPVQQPDEPADTGPHDAGPDRAGMAGSLPARQVPATCWMRMCVDRS